ncbi:MAG: PA14 domain-containing protein, partial [Planctomycetota bacterium]
DLREHALTRTDPQINFNWGLSGPDETVGDDNYSIRWTGELEVPISETYSFYPKVQGGMRLWVDDQLIIDKWQDRGIDERWQDHFPVEHHRAIYLEAGTCPIVMEFAYRQSFGGGAVVVLFWGSPSIPRQVIPQAALSVPLKANRPSPSNGAVDVTQTPTLEWYPGDHAHA